VSNRTRQGLIRGAAAALVVVAALGLSACGAKKKVPGAGAQPPRAVRVARVEPRAMSGGLTASGVLIPREEAAVSSELPGYVVSKVYADVQQWVKKGQPLVQLDDTLLRAQIAQQAAATAQAVDAAKRVKDLDNAGVLAGEDIAARRFQAQAAQAALNNLKVRDARMTIRAPVSGLVMERMVRPGDISSTAVMFRIIRDGLVELEANVPEADLGKIRVGEAAQAVLPDGAAVWGKVRLVSPAVDPDTKLGKVRILLPVRPDLRPGGYARAVFKGGARAVMSAPETAISYSANGPTVMTVDSANRVHVVPVKTGQHGGGYVELTQGPPEGTRVLLGGGAFVLEGDVVKPVETGG
jgi:HlyD family secretion protein